MRAIESAVSYDFDVLGGVILAGKVPAVVRGFTVLQAGAIGGTAEALVIRTAGSTLIHYEATDSGSVFKVPDDRADETLSPTNAKVVGSFTPNAVNFVGLDLVRAVDDSTADTLKFLVPETGAERGRIVPLARTLDYRIVVSTVEFSATPGIAPLYLVTTDSSNQVTALEDARYLMWRLGAGGSSPSAVTPFPWPGGRDETVEALADVAGDRSIFSLKEWCAAAMTRIWEIGGGEFWYSLTADRNVKMSVNTSFLPEGFSWDGTNLLWAQLTFSFDNSNGTVNQVNAVGAPNPGQTDLDDGECLYVDLDRTQDRTGVDQLDAAKAPLQSLGGSDRPGSRWVIAWRVDDKIYVRDQLRPLGEAFIPATTAQLGSVLLTADPIDVGEAAGPRMPHVAFDAASTTGTDYFATTEGFSHNADLVANAIWPAGTRQLQIGRGTAAGDGQILLKANGGFGTLIQSSAPWSAVNPAVYVDNQDTTNTPRTDNKTMVLAGDDNALTHTEAHHFEVGGAIGFRNTAALPETPVFSNPRRRIRSKIFFKTNGLASPATRDQFCVMWWDGSPLVIAESPPY